MLMADDVSMTPDGGTMFHTTGTAQTVCGVEQSEPSQPSKHSHPVSALQTPWKEQNAGHRSIVSAIGISGIADGVCEGVPDAEEGSGEGDSVDDAVTDAATKRAAACVKNKRLDSESRKQQERTRWFASLLPE